MDKDSATRESFTIYYLPFTIHRLFAMATRFMDRIIEVGTKALRRGPVSGETLSAPRRQLQRLRASPFDLACKFKSNLNIITLRSVVSDGSERDARA